MRMGEHGQSLFFNPLQYTLKIKAYRKLLLFALISNTISEAIHHINVN